MMEFCVFFVLPFDEDTPLGDGSNAIEHARKVKEIAEEECLQAYHEIIPEEKRNSHKVWAQSRIDMESRVIGVSLRLPIEKGADHKVVAAVIQDDFLYWDFDELIGAMQAMNEAVTKVALAHGAKPHAVFDDVRYRM